MKNTTITEIINEKNAQNKLAFIPFVVAGDPDFEHSKELLLGLQAIGVDIIELGIPYSDPLADGPVIQLAAKRALKAGMSLTKAIKLVDSIKDKLSVPVIVFSYYNPILAYGLKRFISDIKDAGFKGIIIPDLPVEEAMELINLTREHNLELVMLVTPTSGDERIKKITDATQGFVYLVSVTGVTGVRSAFSESIKESLLKIRKFTTKPICVGFGISNVEHIDQLKSLNAQGVIVGSAIIKLIAEDIDNPNLIQNVQHFVKTLMNHC